MFVIDLTDGEANEPTKEFFRGLVASGSFEPSSGEKAANINNWPAENKTDEFAEFRKIIAELQERASNILSLSQEEVQVVQEGGSKRKRNENLDDENESTKKLRT